VTQTGATGVITGLEPPPGVTITTNVNDTGETQGFIGAPLAVYVVVVAGLAETLGPVAGVNPVLGDHVQV